VAGSEPATAASETEEMTGQAVGGTPSSQLALYA
jgi:hypothetical protein